MKLPGFAVLLITAMGFVMGGCSDNPTQPVSTTNQSAAVLAPLAKSTETPFQGIMRQDFTAPGFLVDPGVIKNPDGKLLINGVMQKVVCEASTDLFSGSAVVTMNGIAEPNITYTAGAGDFHGKLAVTPTGGGGGVWDLNWRAKGTLGALPAEIAAVLAPYNPNDPYGWTIPLKEGGPGKDGTLTGMHVFMENNIYCTVDLKVWVGVYTGIIRSH